MAKKGTTAVKGKAKADKQAAKDEKATQKIEVDADAIAKSIKPQDSHVYFVWTRPYNASYGFTGYTDKDGMPAMIIDKFDKNGEPQPRMFRFNKAHRTMRIPINQKGRDGKNVVEFLRNHPECKGSPNGKYQDGKQIESTIFFKEIKTDEEATVAVKAKEIKLKAETLAINLEDQDLIDAGAMIGVIGKSPAVTKHKVMEYAGNTPMEFLTLMNRSDVKAKSLIRRGLSSSVLTKNGNIIKWEDTILGTDEDKAAASLLNDKTLFEALGDAVERMS